MKLIKKILLAFVSVFVLTVITTICITQIELIVENNKYTTPGNLVDINGKKMNLIIKGNGKNTVVLLSGLGTSSPYLDYRPLIEVLSKQNKVVLVECFGYGWSDQTNISRTNENIVNEIHEALLKSNIKPPYIFVPHSISGLYVLKYSNTYKSDVAGIVGLDISVPRQVKYINPNRANRIRYTIYRLSVDFALIFLPNLYHIQKNSIINVTDDDDKLYRAMIRKNFIRNTVYNETEMMGANEEELLNEKFPYNIPVVLVISSSSQSNHLKEKWDTTWDDLHKELLVNTKIQKTIILNGSHFIHYNNEERIKEIIDKEIIGF